MEKIADYLPSVDQKYYIDEYGNIYDNKRKKFVLHIFKSKTGEHNVKLVINEYPFFKIYGVNVLVNLIFNGLPDKKIRTPITIFIDKNKNNLYYKNLKWVDKKANLEYENLNCSHVVQKIDLDGNRKNNYYKNLRWIDRISNDCYQARHVNKNEFMSDEDIPKIFNEYESGSTLKEIASRYNSNFRFISQVLYGDKRLLATLKAGLTPKRSSPLTPLQSIQYVLIC